MMRHLWILCCLLCTPAIDVQAIPYDILTVEKRNVDSPELDEASKFYRKGLEEMAAGRLDAAEQAFRDARGQYRPVYARLGLVEVACQRKKMDTARELIRQALSEKPDDAYVQDSYSRLLFLDGKLTESEAALKRALVLDPTLVRTHVALGDLYMSALHQPEQAIAAYRNAINQDPNHAGAHYALGVTLQSLGKHKEAEAALREAGRLNQDNPLPMNSLAEVLVSQGKAEEALNVWNEVAGKFPRYIPTYNGRASVYIARRDLPAAIGEYQSIVDFEPENAGAHLNLGMLHQGLGHWQESEAAYLKAVEVKPDLAIAWNNLAWMGAEQGGKPDQSLEWAKRAVELAPESPDFLDTLAWVHRSRGELDSAAAAMQQAIKLAESPSLYYRLGVIEKENNNTAAAIAALERALGFAAFPEKEQARQLLERIKQP